MNLKSLSFFLGTLLLLGTTLKSQDIDSLRNILKKLSVKKGYSADTTRYRTFMDIGNYYQYVMPDSALYYHTLATESALTFKDELKQGEAIRQSGSDNFIMGNYEQAGALYKLAIDKVNILLQSKDQNILIKAKKFTARASSNIGSVFKDQGEYIKALDFYFVSLKMNEDIDNNEGQAGVLGNIGIVYHSQSNYPKALDYYFKSLKKNKETGNRGYQANGLNNIGILYQEQKDYPKALEYNFKALKINEEIGNKNGQASNFHNIGMIYSSQNNYSKSLDYLFKALKINEETGDKNYQASNLEGIGLVYKEKGDSAMEKGILNLAISEKYQKALEYYFKALKLNEEMEVKKGQVGNLNNISSVYIILKKYREAEKHLNQASILSAELNSLDVKQTLNLLFSNLYSKTNRPEKALYHFKEYIIYRDSVSNVANAKAIFQKEMQFNYEKKAAADSLENLKKVEIHKAELKLQKNKQYALYGGLALVIIFAGFMYNRFKITQKQKVVIESQKHVVEEAHKEITDSINYAERLQRSLMASNQLLNKNLDNYFIYFNPKEAVSGDFYWASQLHNGNFCLVAADSTGHGVPGAIMSMLNMNSLKESVIENLCEPHLILNQTRNIVIETLANDGSKEGGKDGMDAALIVFDQQKTKAEFSLANNPLWLIRNRELIEYKADKMPIGKHDKQDQSFTKHELLLEKGDTIYIFTDGYADQFGGEKGKKFMYKPLKELLLSIQGNTMNDQKEVLNQRFIEWKGDLEQVDDVCVIGIRI